MPELLSLYQKYLSEQQEKLTMSVLRDSAAANAGTTGSVLLLTLFFNGSTRCQKSHLASYFNCLTVYIVFRSAITVCD